MKIFEMTDSRLRRLQAAVRMIHEQTDAEKMINEVFAILEPEDRIKTAPRQIIGDTIRLYGTGEQFTAMVDAGYAPRWVLEKGVGK